MPVLYSVCTANVLCVPDGLSLPGSHPASYAGTKPVRTASLKEDKNARGNAPGCMQTGPRQANAVLQIMGGNSTVTGTGAVPAREEAVFLAQPLTSPPDLQGEWSST